VLSALNTPRQRRYEQELEHLGSLPAFHSADYELLTARKVDASAADQEAISNLAGMMPFSGGGGFMLIM